MTGTETVSQLQSSRKSPLGNSGVLTLSGFGVRVRVQNGHLEIEDGVCADRRILRLPRVGHGLKRLVCISEDGFTTLARRLEMARGCWRSIRAVRSDTYLMATVPQGATTGFVSVTTPGGTLQRNTVFRVKP